MEKMWAGRFAKELNKEADDFNSSIHFDCKMYKQDITGSMKHATMLAMQKIITDDDCDKILAGLQSILDDLDSGKLQFDMDAEDIHMFVESELTKRIGDVGKKLHTARSRNDQVAVDIRLYLRDETNEIIPLIKNLLAAILSVAKDNKNTILPGYTHLQRAQPITFAHHLLAYAMMFIRDIGRLEDAVKRMNYSPLGSCALSGTTYNTDREFVAEQLGFDGIMPQKKNPDMAELVRGKTGRVYGDLFTMLTVLKGIPLAYNKDMQEDKECIFDSIATVKQCLKVFAPMIETMKVIKENMYSAAQKGFINATDLADYLAKKGLPFRSAYKLVGQIVAYCIDNGLVLETMPLEQYREYSELFEEDLFVEISLETCVSKRISAGGTGPDSVEKQIEYVEKFI